MSKFGFPPFFRMGSVSIVEQLDNKSKLMDWLFGHC